DDHLLLSVTAHDTRDVASAADSVVVAIADRTAPTARITSLAGDFVVTPGITIPITVQADDAVGVSLIRLRTQGGIVSQQQAPIAPSWLSANVTFNLTIPSETAEASQITLIAEALDDAQNVGSAPRITLTVRDGTPPVVDIVTPLAGSEFIAGSGVSVVAHA